MCLYLKPIELLNSFCLIKQILDEKRIYNLIPVIWLHVHTAQRCL